jgi:hypothetical protein
MAEESLIQELETEKKVHSNEGRRGVENLCRLVRAIGYKDSTHFGQFAHDGSYGDLIEFLEDNSGCVEAIKEWIAEQDIQDWKDNLESELPEKGKCPACGEPLEDDVCQNPDCDS